LLIDCRPRIVISKLIHIAKTGRLIKISVNSFGNTNFTIIDANEINEIYSKKLYIKLNILDTNSKKILGDLSEKYKGYNQVILYILSEDKTLKLENKFDLSNKDLSNGDKVVIASTVLFFDFLVLIFCIFSSWYKNYVLENYIGLLFVFHLIFKNIIISFSFSEENRTKKILGNFFSSRILLYLLPVLSLILVSNIEYKIPSIFYFLFYIYSIIIVGLELIKKVGFYKGNYYFSYYFIHQIVYILLLFHIYT